MELFYPFDGDRKEQTILFEDNRFWVSCGWDKKEVCYCIGLMWKPQKDGEFEGYPIGKDEKPQWFRLSEALAVGFLGSLLGKQPENDDKIVEAINKLVTQQNKQRGIK